MKKIGIMSMQRIFNYGSFLQAFALKRIIESFGYKVTFIDYHPGKVLGIENKNSNNSFRKISKALEVLKLKAPFSEKIRYIKYKENYAKNFLPLLGISSKFFYETDNLDTLVIGSDEVFNCLQKNPQVGFSIDLFGANSHAKKLVSYAASFGNTTFSELKKYNVADEIQEYLLRFDSLSVRDKNSKKIVEDLINSKPSVNIDPVLAYFSKDVLFKTIHDYNNTSLPFRNHNYMILYGYTGRFSLEGCAYIRKFAKNKDLTIVCLGGIQHCCDKFINADPYEVLYLFKNARYIVTDTFHGTILSIISEKPFVTIVRKKGYGNAQKLEDLLLRLKLENRKVTNLRDLDKKIQKPIMYESVNSLLAKLRAEAKEYLYKSL